MVKQAPSTAGTAAIVALRRAGVPHSVHTYHHDPRTELGFGMEAAKALGIAPTRVFKTLMVQVDEQLVVAVVPVSGSLDLKAMAYAAGGKRATMATVSAAERATGYVVGGISPLGQKRRHLTVIDRTARNHPTILVSGGARGVDVEIRPTDLADLTEARFAGIARLDRF